MSPTLYTFGLSVWGAVAELAVAELDVPVEQVSISVAEGENFKPEYLKINPEATVPSLVAEDGKAYTNSTDIVKYIISIAPKKVAPGNAELIAKVHEDGIDPNFVLLTARNDEEFANAQKGFAYSYVNNRQNSLQKHSASPEGAPFTDFYANKLVGNTKLVKLFNGEVPNAEWYEISTKHWKAVVSFITDYLPTVLPESGFIDGAEPGEDDFHVGAWLTRVTWVAGATNAPEGLKPIEKELGGPVPEKVVKYWQAWQKRPSFQKVYEKTLH
ncbi:hypothetical protein BDW22DRAFT_1437600 [Trametopsis cervina]|nr:hypothetical protein BDW22DRAFT_1437600 [Trametopsis cervina]